MKLRNIFAVALAGLAFTACNNDDAPGQDANEGKSTFIGLTIQLPKGTGTKATTGTTNEDKLTKLYVYCWTGMDIGTPTEVDINDATADGSGGYTLNAAIEGVVGNNNIFVTTNTAAAISGLTAAGVTNATPNELTMTLANMTDPTATANGFVMFSDKITVVNAVEATKDEIENTTNTSKNIAAVSLRRAVARVDLTSALTDTESTGTQSEGGYGLLTNIKWNIVNQPELIHPVVKFVTGENFAAGNIVSPYAAFEIGSDVAPTTFVPKSGTATASTQYCKENAHGSAAYLNSNTAAIQVMADFSPATYYNGVTGTTGNISTTTGTNMTVATFYTLKAATEGLAANTFFDATAAGQLATITSKTETELFNKYTDGKCYWSIPLHNGASPKVYGVLRNNLYTVNIKSITAPGLPAFPTNDDPIAAEAWIKVTITVEAWNDNPMGDVELK